MKSVGNAISGSEGRRKMAENKVNGKNYVKNLLSLALISSCFI